MTSFQFNNTVNGGNAQINQGQTVTGTQNNSSVPVELTTERIVEEVTQALPAEVPEPERIDIQQELQQLAAMSIVQQQEPATESRIQTLIERVSPWAPKIREGLWAFGEASLKSLASSNPVIAGLLAMCEKFNKNDA